MYNEKFSECFELRMIKNRMKREIFMIDLDVILNHEYVVKIGRNLLI